MVSVIVEVEWCCLRESPSYGSRSFDSQAQGRARKQIKGIAIDQDFFHLGELMSFAYSFPSHFVHKAWFKKDEVFKGKWIYIVIYALVFYMRQTAISVERRGRKTILLV